MQRGTSLIVALMASLAWSCASDDSGGGGGAGGMSDANTAPGALGDPCVSNVSGSCASGLGCTPNGKADGVDFAGYCRELCMDDAGCESAERCIAGLCVPVCTLWESGCPDGYWCAPFLVTNDPALGGCQKAGTAQIGEACVRTLDCAANGICLSPPGNFCHAMCDANHACAAGSCDLLAHACYPSG